VFGGEDLISASSWNFGFKPWWMHALMFVMCAYIDIQNMYDDGEYFQNILF